MSPPKLFTKQNSQMAEIVPDTSLATLNESLPLVRSLFCGNLNHTSISGTYLRHGIMHGRELAYGTLINSAKAFALLQAVVEWVMAEQRRIIAEHRDQEQHRWAGSDEVNERGRRRDDREFSETREALRGLQNNQMGWGRNEGRYNPDLAGFMKSNFDRARLPRDHGIQMHVADDGQSWYAWRETISGWTLGIGAVGVEANCRFYDGPQPPPGGPDQFPHLWINDATAATPPNWEG